MPVTSTYTIDEETAEIESVTEEIKLRIINEIESKLRPLAQGNEGYVKVEQLDFEGTRLKVHVLIRHKHKISRGVYAYKAKTYIKIDTDVTNPEPDDLKICIDTPIGQACITIEDLIRIIATLI